MAIDIRPHPSATAEFPERYSHEASVVIITAHWFLHVLFWTICTVFQMPNLASHNWTASIFVGSYMVTWIPAIWFSAQYELNEWAQKNEPAFPSPVCIFIDWGYIFMHIGFPLLLYSLIVLIGKLSCKVGRSLYIIDVEDTSECEEVDQLACLTATFFFLNFVLCIAWCAIRFDSTGTAVPSWTNLFG